MSESVHDSRTLERELSSLRAVRDNYPKTLITLDDERPVDHEGIRQVYALDWLLDGNEQSRYKPWLGCCIWCGIPANAYPEVFLC